MECYCDARNKPIRCKITKPQTASAISLWFWGLLAYPELYCDWPLHNQHSWNFSGVHGFLSLTVIQHCDLLKFLGHVGPFLFLRPGFWYFAEFSGANSRKNRPISRKKSQSSWKNRPISLDFSGKNSNFEGFLEKSADFTGNFGGKLRQETISKKTADFAGLFLGKFR